jgi:nitrate/nitrite transport system ATP-binding protein
LASQSFGAKTTNITVRRTFGMPDSSREENCQRCNIEVLDKEKNGSMITHDVDESIFLADRVIKMTSDQELK